MICQISGFIPTYIFYIFFKGHRCHRIDATNPQKGLNVSHAESANAQEEPQRIQGPKPWSFLGGCPINLWSTYPAKEIAFSPYGCFQR